jgi:hypothetical protein
MSSRSHQSTTFLLTHKKMFTFFYSTTSLQLENKKVFSNNDVLFINHHTRSKITSENIDDNDNSQETRNSFSDSHEALDHFLSHLLRPTNSTRSDC